MSLHLYKPLGDNDESTRLEAARSLTTELLALVSGERTVKTKSDIDYALKRLTRGLASGRESARPGFAVVLTEYMTALQAPGNPEKWDIPLEKIIELIKNHTTSQGSSGQEERDYYLGRLFGLQSLFQSNVLFFSEEKLVFYSEALVLLFELAKKKPWLSESCAWTICSAIPRWSAEIKTKAAEMTYAALVEAGLTKTSEGVGIWMMLQASHPEIAPPKDVWAKDSPLNVSSLALLAKVVKEGGQKKDGEEMQQKGSWNPKLHFVWETILAFYFSEERTWKMGREGKGVAGWAEFWRVVVDESLFAASSSEERKFWGFLIFIKSLEVLISPEQTPHLSAIFTKNFMRCLINQLSDPKRYLNKAAQKVTRALLQKAESSSWSVPIIVSQLILNNGTPNFDHLTKTKTVEKIISSADESGLVQIVAEFKRIFLNPLGSDSEASDQEQKTVEVRRQWAADQILSIVRNGKSPKSPSWLEPVINMFATFGHFDMVDKKRRPKVPFSTASQAMFRSRLLSCLSHLIALKDQGDESWPHQAVKVIVGLEKETGKCKLAIEVDETIREALNTSVNTLEKIRKKRATAKKEKQTQLESFSLLFSLVILQVYSGESDALGVLDELQLCYDRVVRNKSAPEDVDIDANDVLVEILLSFLSKPSALLRKLAQQVFTTFAGKITENGLELLFNVLETKETLMGQQELFDKENEDEDMDSDVEELDSDVEVLDAESMDVDSDSESTPDWDSASESAPEDEDETSRLEAALAEALGTHRADLDAAVRDSDSDDGKDMSDSEMLALDEKLIQIFKQRKSTMTKKQEKKEAKENITNFKNRILDLLEIFAKTQHANPLALRILLPLLKTVRITTSKQVAEKACAVVKSLAHACRGNNLPVMGDGRAEEVWALLEGVHAEAAREGSNAHAAACSQASLLVMKVLVGEDRGNIQKAVDVYAKSLTRWLTDKKCRLQPGLFTDLINWASSASRQLQNEKSNGN
ncbi:DNA-directed DNA polymerase [Rhizina undulata]